MMDQQPQALEEIQDENQEGELQAETEYTEDVPCKKGKVDIPMLTYNKKEMLKHLPHLHNVLLTGGKEKVRQTCVKLKNQYGEVMNHFKAGNANCNNLTKDDLATVLIPDDFDEIQNPEENQNYYFQTFQQLQMGRIYGMRPLIRCLLFSKNPL